VNRSERFKKVFSWFMENVSVAETELQYKNAYELMVAVILSAQCTDKRVNMITPAFFKTFPDVFSLADADIRNIFEHIKSCSYPNSKAKNLSGMAKTLVNDYKGVVPEDTHELQKLPGVGRKTANVIASVIYNKPALAVDTHVFRVTARIGLTLNSKTPLDTEKQLIRFIPEELIPKAHHWLILHGRYICKARKPMCEICGLKEFCRYYSEIKKSGIIVPGNRSVRYRINK